MILPIRCFTCNRLLADEKLPLFEKWRNMPYAVVKEYFQSTLEQTASENPEIFQDPSCVVVLNPTELKPVFQYKPVIVTAEPEKARKDCQERKSAADPSQSAAAAYPRHDNSKHFTVSPTSEFLLLNMMGVEQYCCRRMFISYVNMIENIS